MDMEIQSAKFNLIMDNINRFLGNNTNWSLGTAGYVLWEKCRCLLVSSHIIINN